MAYDKNPDFQPYGDGRTNRDIFADLARNNLTATVKLCTECKEVRIHYTARGGWPICHFCGFNAELQRLADILPPEPPRRGFKWPWEK